MLTLKECFYVSVSFFLVLIVFWQRATLSSSGCHSQGQSTWQQPKQLPNEPLKHVQSSLEKDPYCQVLEEPIVHKSKVFKRGNVEGWMTTREMCVLYQLSLWSSGPVGEQGTHVGKSTVAIARGIRDSNVNKEFVTADIFPLGVISPSERKVSPHNYTPWYHTYLSREPQNVHQMNYNFGTNKQSRATWARRSYLYDVNGGLITWLVAHLNEQGLLKYVFIVKGDRLPTLGYRFVFIDVAHDVQIIRHNFWSWNRLITPGNPIVFAVHDTVAENRKEFERLFPNILHSFQVDSLFIFEVDQLGSCDVCRSAD